MALLAGSESFGGESSLRIGHRTRQPACTKTWNSALRPSSSEVPEVTTTAKGTKDDVHSVAARDRARRFQQSMMLATSILHDACGISHLQSVVMLPTVNRMHVILFIMP